MLLVGAGTACVALAALGAVLPILPTTPFLLVAAACYARASERLHARLLANRQFGPAIRSWQEHRALPRSVKRRACAAVPVAFGFSILAVDLVVADILLVATAGSLLLFLLRIPTRG